MPRDLSELARWAQPARTVLLLGAGASIPSGIPGGEALKRALVDELRPSLGYDRSLASTAEILELHLGRRPIVDVIAKLCDRTPMGGMAALPAYPWRGCFTINYDLLVERAAAERDIELVAVRSNYDMPVLEEHPTALRLFKIHGCITEDRAYGSRASIILTESDYRERRQWREAQLRAAVVELETRQLLIIGNSLNDQYLHDLVDDMAALQSEMGLRDRVKVLAYEEDEEIANLYARRHIEVVFGGIDAFFAEMAGAQEEGEEAVTPTPIMTQYALPIRLLAATIDVAQAKSLSPAPARMFSGSPATYADIAAGLTFQRRLEQDIAIRMANGSHAVPVLVGVAGVGKTTTARRFLAQQLDQGVACWEHRAEMPFDSMTWASVEAGLRDRGLSGLLLLDNVTRIQRDANALLRRLEKIKDPALRVIATAEAPQWRKRVKHRNFYTAGEPIEVSLLEREDVIDLVDLLTMRDEIRELVPTDFLALSRPEQVDYLVSVCNTDMFVCLRNIFAISTLDEIILEEFGSLDDEEQEVYRHVAALEAAGVRPHRQLLIRLLGLDGAAISNLYSNLEGLLLETAYSEIEGLYIWWTRHLVIAQILADYKYADPAEHLQLIRDVARNLNPSVTAERDSIRELCNSAWGISRIGNMQDRVQIYRDLVKANPRDNVLRHRLIGEYLRFPDVAAAEAELRDAIDAVGIDPPLHRYRIRILRLRAKRHGVLRKEDREALLRQAREVALEGVSRYPDNWLTVVAVDDVARDWLELTGDFIWLSEAVDTLEDAYDRLLEPQLREQLERSRRLLAMKRRESGS